MLARRVQRCSLVEGGSCPGSTNAPMVPPSKRIVRPGPCRRCAKVAASNGMPTPAKTTWPSRKRRLAITTSSSLVVWLRAGVLLVASVVIDAPPAPRGIEQLLHADEVEILGPALGPVEIAIEVLRDTLGRILAHQLGVHVMVLEEGLIDAVALVRRAAEGHLDHGLDREERDFGLVGRAADLVVGDDPLGSQDHAISRHREIDI